MNEKQFEIVKSWGVLKAEKFGEDWTVDDEQTYQRLFGKPNKGKLVKRVELVVVRKNDVENVYE